ncbi:MAG TPA: hypothetical protein VMM60_11555 [Ilumatobacter sp.]|nr:hypothetical protein [Ilumatobacter sp.]
MRTSLPCTNGALSLIEFVDDIEYHLLSPCGHSPMVEHQATFINLFTDFVSRRG